jgi:lactoylglutathione lyase
MAHACIGVEDLEKSVSFYTDVLGMKETERRTLANGTTLVMMNSGGETEVELTYRGQPQAAAPAPRYVGLRHVAFFVSDIDATVKALKEKGVEFYREPGPKGAPARAAFFRDPNGADIELMQK